LGVGGGGPSAFGARNRISTIFAFMMRKGVHIQGLVQGVWFRKYTADKAAELGLVGFVKNMPDGSVYTEVEGSPEKVTQFIDWCTVGSPLSKVESVTQDDIEVRGESTFEILW
jgi:acylphosphatase